MHNKYLHDHIEIDPKTYPITGGLWIQLWQHLIPVKFDGMMQLQWIQIK